MEGGKFVGSSIKISAKLPILSKFGTLVLDGFREMTGGRGGLRWQCSTNWHLF